MPQTKVTRENYCLMSSIATLVQKRDWQKSCQFLVVPDVAPSGWSYLLFLNDYSDTVFFFQIQYFSMWYPKIISSELQYGQHQFYSVDPPFLHAAFKSIFLEL